jgi:hypothetical protein
VPEPASVSLEVVAGPAVQAEVHAEITNGLLMVAGCWLAKFSPEQSASPPPESAGLITCWQCFDLWSSSLDSSKIASGISEESVEEGDKGSKSHPSLSLLSSPGSGPDRIALAELQHLLLNSPA